MNEKDACHRNETILPLVIMTQSQFWSHLSPQLQWSLESQAKNLKFKRGEFVYREGDLPEGLHFIVEGLIGLTKYGPSGKEYLLRFFRQNQFFGHRSLFSGENYHSSAISLQPTKIKVVPKNVVLQILKEHPHLYLEVVQVLARELGRCENQHVLVLDNQIHARVAQSLVYLKDLHPNHNWTRQEIASFCASTVSTVIKALADLENWGLIRQTGRKIEILQRDQLISFQDDEDPSN